MGGVDQLVGGERTGMEKRGQDMAATKRATQAQGGRSGSGGWLFRSTLGAISALTYYTLAVRPWLLRWGKDLGYGLMCGGTVRIWSVEALLRRAHSVRWP